MKLSFVIPAYNEEKYIGNCLRSILNAIKERPHDIEIIVVNNASADKTKEIALSFPGVVVIDEPRKGLTNARMTGYLAATGELIANVDADDILPLGWLEKIFNEFAKNDKLVAISGPIIYYDLPWHIKIQVKIFYVISYIIYLINHFILRKGAIIQGGNSVIKKSALNKIGGYNTDITFYGEDTDLARRLQKIGYIKFTFGFPMFSSGRRLAKEGVLKTGLRYVINYFWVIFFKKPFTKSVNEINKN
jgi:glycosyltransferase involved in cell wall biosynthesis